jgi:glucose-1-phosphate adenylyltransferase
VSASSAVVRYSIIMTDATIRAGAMVDRCIVDKQTEIGAGAQVGYGADYTPSPVADLSSGLTLVGKGAVVPPGVKVGRNCIIAGDVRPEDFIADMIPSGTVVGYIGDAG